jgi:hypothetical protein
MAENRRETMGAIFLVTKRYIPKLKAWKAALERGEISTWQFW